LALEAERARLCRGEAGAAESFTARARTSIGGCQQGKGGGKESRRPVWPMAATHPPPSVGQRNRVAVPAGETNQARTGDVCPAATK
jgi:hypothetical protein